MCKATLVFDIFFIFVNSFSDYFFKLQVLKLSCQQGEMPLEQAFLPFSEIDFELTFHCFLIYKPNTLRHEKTCTFYVHDPGLHQFVSTG